MTKFELEYIIKSSPKVVYERLSNASGLCEWFADDVNQSGDIFTFIWEGAEQQARLLQKKENKTVRFHWLDHQDESTYFEFRLQIDALTKDLALIITDFATEDEMDDAIELWDISFAELKRAIGV